MSLRENQEIKYLKKISGVSSLTIKKIEFIELEKQDRNNLSNLYSNKFKPSDKDLFEYITQTSILKEIINLYNKKINLLTSKDKKEYYFLTKFCFGTLVKKNIVENQKINNRYNTIPLYIIPTLIKLSFDTKGIKDDDTILIYKEKIKSNESNIEFIIADKPYIPQELFDYSINDEIEIKNDFYLPLFDLDETDRQQSLMLKFYKNEKEARFPLNDKKDEDVKITDYLDSLEFKEVSKENLQEFFEFMESHLNQVKESKKEILDKNNYEINISKTLFSLADKDVDILYKAYCFIDDSINKSSVNINGTLAESFFQKNENNILNKTEEIYFDSKNHYGSFNINVASDKDLISLALNQRIVLNTTNSINFKDGDVLAVNGPPGTGKTTVLQSIIANLVTENLLSFIDDENKNFLLWDKNSKIKTPKLLNFGCSFTQQAVKNILNSLNFDAPKYNKKEIDLVWNKRWIYYQNSKDELGYVLDSAQSNESKNKISFFISNIDEINSFFIEKYNCLFTKESNIEKELKEELLNIKKSLNLFDLSLFKNCFYLNELTNQYEIKSKYFLLEIDLEEKIKDNIIKINNINNSLKESEKTIKDNNEKLNKLKTVKIELQNRLKNLTLKDYQNIKFQPISTLVNNYYKLMADKELLIEIIKNLKNTSYLKIEDNKLKIIIETKKLIKKEFEKLNEDLNTIENNLSLKNDEISTLNIQLENIKKSLLSKFKIKILGKDNKIDITEKNIKTLNSDIKSLNFKKEKTNKNLIEQKSEEAKIEDELLEYITILEKKSLQDLEEKNLDIQLELKKITELLDEEILFIKKDYAEKENLITNFEYNQKTILIERENLLKDKNTLIEINKILQENINEIKLGREEIILILKTIKNNLKNKNFEEFFYAKESIDNLLFKIEENNINLLDLYNDLNIILDNTLRYKCFQLSMRLKEFYFIKITKEISNLPENASYQSYNTKIKSFKNTSELYEFHYLSLIFPLIISTLHSLENRVKLFQGGKTVALPGKIDNVIVDESGQISVEIGYIAAWNAKKLLCVGDTDQIKPVFSVEKKLDYFISQKDKRIESELSLDDYCTEKDNLGQVNCCETSLMNIAQKLTKYHQYKHLALSRGLYLVEHRRCPDEIINYCNEIIYKGILIPKKGTFESVWKKENEVIKNNIKAPWEFIKVKGVVDMNKNEAEAIAIYNYVENLINKSNGKYSWENIGRDLAILSPFRNQADSILDLIKEKTKNKFNFYKWSNRLRVTKEKDSDEDLIIGTVHALQGAEKKIILFSFVSDSLSSNSMVIKDKSILNVAISRSKLNIIMFGSDKVYNNKSKELEIIRKYIDN